MKTTTVDAEEWRVVGGTGQASAESATIATKEGEQGVIPSHRDPKTGRFLPGAPNGPGRSISHERAVLHELRRRITPEMIVDKIEWLINHHNSWRAVAAGVQIALDYQIGKPAQRQLEVSDNLDLFIARLRQLSNANDN